MILTFKQKHGKDFSRELAQAKQVADFAIKHRVISSKYVSHFGLKSEISNQILRKYARNKKCKGINSVNLTIPGRAVKLNKDEKTMQIPCLKLSFNYFIATEFEKINQIEISKEYYFISVTVKEPPPAETDKWVGVDLNTNGHAVVAANPHTGKVLKWGKQCKHIHHKYQNIRNQLQKRNATKKLKVVKRRESRIIKDVSHKVSRALVEWAKESNTGLKFELLKGIRQTTKQAKSFKYSLNSWSYYQLQQFVDYKAKLAGVAVVFVDPAYTSQTDSRSGLIAQRRGFSFKRLDGVIEHSGVNAAFNIALRQALSLKELDGRTKSSKSQKLKVGDMSPFRADILRHQSMPDRDCIEGNTDIPPEALLCESNNLRTPRLKSWEYVRNARSYSAFPPPRKRACALVRWCTRVPLCVSALVYPRASVR